MYIPLLFAGVYLVNKLDPDHLAAGHQSPDLMHSLIMTFSAVKNKN